MQYKDALQEERFFGLFRDFYDLEKDANRQHDAASYSLDRMIPLAELAGRPDERLKVIHVAGTKGKGSTCHYISALLVSAGHHAGLFTSPHLSTVRERFQLDNRPAGYELLLEEGASFVSAIKKAGLHPSLFEIFTILAEKLFVDQGMEYAVMETGIGGRLDATNHVARPVITAISSISFDHMALLGNSIQEIAAEKGGIIKPGVPLVLSRQPFEEAEKVLRGIASDLGAMVLDPASSAECRPFLAAGMPEFLADNFRTAFRTVGALGVAPDPAAFRMPSIRARFELVCRNPMVMLDGAHNGDSMEKLVSALSAIYAGVGWTVVLGCVKGKDVRGMARALKRLEGADFILVNPRTPRASALEELEAEARAAGLEIRAVVPELSSRSQLPAGRPLLFTGSFFTACIGDELYGQSPAQ